MKRYYNEEKDDDEDFGFEDNEDEEDEDGIIIDVDFEDVAMQIDLMHTQLKERLLAQAKNIAQQNIWWWFRNPMYKTNIINKIFKKLVKAIYDDEEKEKG